MEHHSHAPINPNTAVQNCMYDVLKDPNTASMNPDDWAKMRSRAFSDGDIIMATGVTMAQVKIAFGNTDQVDARVLELLREPGQCERTEEQWRDMRSAAWTRNDLKEAAALTYASFLMTFRPHHMAQHVQRRLPN